MYGPQFMLLVLAQVACTGDKRQQQFPIRSDRLSAKVKRKGPLLATAVAAVAAVAAAAGRN
jgi:hypothetical protein